MEPGKILIPIRNYLGDKIVKDLWMPIDSLIDKNLVDVSSSIGAFIIREIAGKFYRQISFTVGQRYADNWMEEALYGVLYKYNDITRKASRLELTNKTGYADGSMMYARLADGAHSLKYQKWRITVAIATNSNASPTGRVHPVRTYIILTPSMDPEFVESFKNELIEQRDAILKINSKGKFINVYKDDPDGSVVYWDKQPPARKRYINTIYIPRAQLETIVNTINTFFADRNEYERRGVPWNLKILLYGAPGSGKAQPISTPIPTPNGWTTMGELKVGSEVFTDDGSVTKVKEVYPQGVKDIYKVTFRDGRTAECCKDHLWTVYVSSHGRMVPRVLSTEQLMGNLQTSDGHSRYSIPTLTGPVMYPKRDVPVHPYVIGALIGNGCLKEGQLKISHGDYTVPKKIADIYGWHPQKESQFNYSWVFYNTETWNKIRIDEFLESVPELIGKLSGEKEIPEIYLHNDVETRMELLRGLMDTDGSISFAEGRYHVSYSSCSKKLLKQIQELIQSLGYHGNISEDKRVEKYRSGYHGSILFHVPAEFKPEMFSVGHKAVLSAMAATHPAMRHYEFNQIINIELVRSEESQCIRVESPSSLYVTDQFILTHNTSLARMIASEWGRNLYEINGGKSGKTIPTAIEYSDINDVQNPLFVINDLDRFPQLVSEAPLDISKKDDATEERLGQRQVFRRFLNALDGSSSGEGKIIIATANDISSFSPTLLREGRFDLKMEIGYVNEEVFRKFVFDIFHREINHPFYLAANNLTIGMFNQDTLIKKMSYDEFMDKYTSDSPPPPLPKEPDEKPEEARVEPPKKTKPKKSKPDEIKVIE